MAMVFEQLDAIRGLKENWDGYGAAAPCQSAIELAQAFLYLLDAVKRTTDARILHVSPTRVGGVLIDWEDATAEHDIEINPDGSLVFLHRNKATKQIETRAFSPGQKAVIHPGVLQELR